VPNVSVPDSGMCHTRNGIRGASEFSWPLSGLCDKQFHISMKGEFEMAKLNEKVRECGEDLPLGDPLHSPLQEKTRTKTGETVKEPERRTVFCTHGVHSGDYKVGGMTVAQARKELGGVLNIPHNSVCVIDAKVQKEDFVIGEDVQMMSFIKQASVKGGF
jgi:hypothetical protein